MNVFLHVYDVPGPSESIDSLIQRVNEWGRSISAGGVFHGAIEVDNLEWSFGGCPSGSGVYSIAPKQNPMYAYRETVPLGPTTKTRNEVKQILKRLRAEWTGPSYDLLRQNCCHFSEAFAKELGVAAVPGWLNRAAVSAEAAVALSNRAYALGSNATATISNTATSSYGWLCNSFSGLLQQQQQQDGGFSQQEQTGEESVDVSTKLRAWSFGHQKNQKLPARDIWEGGIQQASPLQANLNLQRDPSLSGISQLPDSHASASRDAAAQARQRQQQQQALSPPASFSTSRNQEPVAATDSSANASDHALSSAPSSWFSGGLQAVTSAAAAAAANTPQFWKGLSFAANPARAPDAECCQAKQPEQNGIQHITASSGVSALSYSQGQQQPYEEQQSKQLDPPPRQGFNDLLNLHEEEQLHGQQGSGSAEQEQHQPSQTQQQQQQQNGVGLGDSLLDGPLCGEQARSTSSSGLPQPEPPSYSASLI